MRTPPTYELVTPKQVMNKVTAPSMPFGWSINPYRGCTHGCSFCYARSTHAYMGLSSDDSFRQHVFIKEDAADILEEQLHRKLRRHGGDYARLAQEIGLLTIGTATDPYQPIEARQRVTRDCLEVLARYRVPTSITTRSPLILRDLDILQHMCIDSINFSVNTIDNTIWRNLEPATPAPIKRLEAVQTLVDAGIPTGVFMAPIMPFLTDSEDQMQEVIAAAVHHRAAFIMRSVLRLTPEVKTWFLQTLRDHYPDLLPRYQRLYKTAYPPTDYVSQVMETAQKLMRKYHVKPYTPTQHPQEAPTNEQMILPI